MAEPEIKVAELKAFEKIKSLKMETKHERARDDLVLELKARDDAFDTTLEQYDGVQKELLIEAKDRYDLGDSKVQDLLKNLLGKRKMLDWLNSQKEQAYFEFIKRVSKGEEKSG